MPAWLTECRAVCEACLGEGSVLHDEAPSTLELDPRTIWPISGCFISVYAHNDTGCLFYVVDDAPDAIVHEIRFASLRALQEILVSLFRPPHAKRQRSETQTQHAHEEPRRFRRHAF